MSETEKSTAQPGETRVTRANILRRIGRVCFADGDRPGLPAPKDVGFNSDGVLWLTFDSYEEAAAWAARYELTRLNDRTYQPEWRDAPIRTLDASGLWEGVRVTISGWSPAVEIPDSAPEDTDPDNLEAVES